jgi:hypothetical protein
MLDWQEIIHYVPGHSSRFSPHTRYAIKYLLWWKMDFRSAQHKEYGPGNTEMVFFDYDGSGRVLVPHSGPPGNIAQMTCRSVYRLCCITAAANVAAT